MNQNPYSAPEADLDVEADLRKGWAWKLYFVFVVLLLILSMFVYAAMENTGVADIVSNILAVPATIGFFGYVFTKKIYIRQFWLANFWVQVIWGVAYYFLTDVDLRGGMDEQSFIISQIVIWVLFLPYYVALYRYGSRNNQMWHGEKI